MTSQTTKHITRGPLSDKTNVYNMKSNNIVNNGKVGGNLKVDKGLENKKSYRVKKKSILLDENVYQIDRDPKTISKEKHLEKEKDFGKNKVRVINKETDPFQNNINGPDTLINKELFIKITRREDENKKAYIEPTVVKKCNRETKRNTLLDETIYHMVGSHSESTQNLKVNINEYDQKIKGIENTITEVEKNIVKENTFCLKELFVKIPRIPDNCNKVSEETTPSKQSSRTRRKSIFIDGNNDKNTNAEEIECRVRETGIIQLANTKNALGTKKLLTGNRTESENASKKQNARIRKKSAIIDENLYRVDKYVAKTMQIDPNIVKEMEIIQLENNIPNFDPKNALGIKELVIKLPKLIISNYQAELAKTSNKQSARIRKKSAILDENLYQIDKTTTKGLLNGSRIVSNEDNDRNMTRIKFIDGREKKKNMKQFGNVLDMPELVINIPRMVESGNRIDLEETSIRSNGNMTKSLKNNLNLVINNKNDQNCKSIEIEDKVKEIEKTLPAQIPQIHNKNGAENKKNPIVSSVNKKSPQKTENFKLPNPKIKESHNLRTLEPKNYMEDSTLNSTTDSTKPEDRSVKSNMQKKDGVPIYRKMVPEEPKNDNLNDLYEFFDVSPKAKKPVKKRPHRSSILFDKDTHEILQRIEEKEAKAKKKIVRKKKALKPVPEKSYDKIVDGIVSSVKEKILKKKGGTLESNNKLATQSKPLNSAKTQNNMLLNNNHNKVIRLNNFNDEMSLIVHSSAAVPLSKEKSGTKLQMIAKNMENITFKRGGAVAEDNIAGHSRDPAAEECVPKNKALLDVFDRIKESVNALKPLPFDSISIVCPKVDSVAQNDNDSNCGFDTNASPPLLSPCDRPDANNIPDNNPDNSDIQTDIDSCFGFDIDNIPPPLSIPNKPVSDDRVNILGNVTIRHGDCVVDSPIDFNVRRPNANSTMIHIRPSSRTSSPWRLNWVNARPNPYFVSIKNNALPRTNQDMVMDHTLVEEYESFCSKTPKKGSEMPARKDPVQQSILDFIESNIEVENVLVQSSLFDYEAFNSPVKKTRKGKENQKVEDVKRKLLGNKDSIVASTPIKRKVLGDISNSSEEQIPNDTNSENDTYFGFNQSASEMLKPVHEKRKNKGHNLIENIENDNMSKPSRFDLSALKSYAAKKGTTKRVVVAEEEVTVPDKSISLVEASDENIDQVVHLFDEPEEILDNMSPVCIIEKKQRRKRLDSSASDAEEGEKKRKKHKKTKLEIEKEKWIEEFNQMCQEIDKHELELE